MRQMLNVLAETTASYKAKVVQPSPNIAPKAIIDANFDISQVNNTAMQGLVGFFNSASMQLLPDLGRAATN